MQDSASGAAYKLVFSNHSEAPLFPRSTLHPWFEFRFIDALNP